MGPTPAKGAGVGAGGALKPVAGLEAATYWISTLSAATIRSPTLVRVASLDRGRAARAASARCTCARRRSGPRRHVSVVRHTGSRRERGGRTECPCDFGHSGTYERVGFARDGHIADQRGFGTLDTGESTERRLRQYQRGPIACSAIALEASGMFFAPAASNSLWIAEAFVKSPDWKASSIAVTLSFTLTHWPVLGSR